MPNYDVTTEQVVALFRQTTTLGVIRDFLKSKGLPSSANSWSDLENLRLKPLVEKNRITNDELVEFLRVAEESGKQHVFLYKCNPADAVAFMDRARAKEILEAKELGGLLDAPDVFAAPEAGPQIVDIRWDDVDGVDQVMTVKEIERRTHYRFSHEEPYGDNFFHRVFEKNFERSVNVFKLHRGGFAEVRISSLSTDSAYQNEISRFWKVIDQLIPREKFGEISLRAAKAKIWNDRAELAETIRYSDATVCDGSGAKLKAATGAAKSDLIDSKAVSDSLDYVLENDNKSYCDAHNVWFKASDGLPDDIRVYIGGEPNEFAIPTNCSAEDYQYVLRQIRFLNS